jgi:ribose 5-phosphate isomerase B
MKLLIASDHAGFEMKKELIPFLKEAGFDIVDLGAKEYDPADDYPDFIAPLARMVSQSPDKYIGIILGGSGQGEAIVANRFPNIRAVVFNGQYDPQDDRRVPNEIVISKEHNNANVLSIGARFLNIDEVRKAVSLWLNTPFSNDRRHVRRIEKIDNLSLS